MVHCVMMIGLWERKGWGGRAEQWARKDESLGSRAISEDVHSLEDGRPEDLALYTDDKDERSGN